MTYRNIYISPSTTLAQARKVHGSREISMYASSRLIEGVLDELVAQALTIFKTTGWPKTARSGSQRLAVWIRPACESYLTGLAKKHNTSMPKITLAWMEAAAKHHLGASVAQAVACDHAQAPKPSAPISAPHQMAPEPQSNAQPVSSRTVDGREQRLFECNRHRLMSHDQIAQVFQNGGLWLDHKIHSQAMANAWTLDQLLEYMAQNSGMASNIIAIARTPAPTAAAPSAAAQPHVAEQSHAPASEPNYAADFFAAGLAMFDPNRLAE